MNFEFATSTRILFGGGQISQLAAHALAFGNQALVITGGHPERYDSALDSLRQKGISVSLFSVHGEPQISDIIAGTNLARKCGAQVVIGLGGGSVVDAGKAISAMATQPQDLWHYLEIVGKGQPLTTTPLPYIAVPTTAGTGAEVTRNAVLSSPEHGVKASLRHASMLPRLAIIDPELTLLCPANITAASGMDAFTQCLEAYVSCRANPLTDALCLSGIQRCLRSLEKVVRDGSDLDARTDIAYAAMLSGMALANAGLGAVHGFAAPIGGTFHAPHGAVCAALLAPVWEANLATILTHEITPAHERFLTVARMMTGDPTARAEDAVPYLKKLTQTLAIPALGHWGIQDQHLDDIATKAAASSSMKGNPVVLEHGALREILVQAVMQKV
jgi:alcohol dehydrogenase class IV